MTIPDQITTPAGRQTRARPDLRASQPGLAPPRAEAFAALKDLMDSSAPVQRLQALQRAAAGGTAIAAQPLAAPARQPALSLPRETDLRRSALSAVLAPVTGPVSPRRAGLVAQLRGSSLFTQPGAARVIQRAPGDGDDNSGYIARILNSFKEVAAYGKVAVTSKIIGTIMNTSAYLGAAIETLIWAADKEAGANTIIPIIASFSAQYSYCIKNISAYTRSASLVRAKRREYDNCARAYAQALHRCAHNPGEQNFLNVIDLREQGRELYAELEALLKKEWAFGTGVTANLAGVLLAGANLIAFVAEHKDWRTAFGPDLTTVLSLLSLLMPLLQKLLESWAHVESKMPEAVFDADVRDALAEIRAQDQSASSSSDTSAPARTGPGSESSSDSDGDFQSFDSSSSERDPNPPPLVVPAAQGWGSWALQKLTDAAAAVTSYLRSDAADARQDAGDMV